MISVTPHARNREDRAGDPLDGLVNLFDLGIVLAVAFLLAALSSLHLSGALTAARAPRPEGAPDHDQARADGRAAAQAGRADDRPRRPGRRRLPAGQRPARVRAAGSGRQAALSMGFLWSQLRQAVPLIYHGDTYIWSVTWVTLRAGAGLDRRGDRDRPAVRARARAGAVSRPPRAAGAGQRQPGAAVGRRRRVRADPAAARRGAGIAADRIHAARRLHRADAAGAAVHRRARPGRDPGAGAGAAATGAGARRGTGAAGGAGAARGADRCAGGGDRGVRLGDRRRSERS